MNKKIFLVICVLLFFSLFGVLFFSQIIHEIVHIKQLERRDYKTSIISFDLNTGNLFVTYDIDKIDINNSQKNILEQHATIYQIIFFIIFVFILTACIMVIVKNIYSKKGDNFA